LKKALLINLVVKFFLNNFPSLIFDFEPFTLFIRTAALLEPFIIILAASLEIDFIFLFRVTLFHMCFDFAWSVKNLFTGRNLALYPLF
jgi:hypothetical protein